MEQINDFNVRKILQAGKGVRFNCVRQHDARFRAAPEIIRHLGAHRLDVPNGLHFKHGVENYAMRNSWAG